MRTDDMAVKSRERNPTDWNALNVAEVRRAK